MTSLFANAGIWIATMAVLSVGSLLLCVAIGSRLIRTLPGDYFTQARRPERPFIRSVVLNLVGGVLLVAGVVMLFIPGQGLLTILLGLILMDFPGKYALERRIVARHGLLDTINRLRARSGVPPLQSPGNMKDNDKDYGPH